MDKNMDYFSSFPGFQGFAPCDVPDGMGMENPMFNPMMQYEQAYMYYRYLAMQMEYKIKCKEYEKLCGKTEGRDNRKIE